MQTKKIVICKDCNQTKPHFALGKCRQCYQHGFRKANPIPLKPGSRARGGLGLCLCRQPAVTRVWLRFGDYVEGARNGEYFNLCADCAEKEREQRRATD
jgi:ribosomal protein L40E